MEASHLFNECATFKDDGTVFFDLGKYPSQIR